MKALILALALASPASAAQLKAPDQYNHPYEGQLTIHYVDRHNVWRECSGGGEREIRRDAAGCAYTGETSCYVYIAKKTRRADIDAILLHEIAHCNGWPHDHPKE